MGMNLEEIQEKLSDAIQTDWEYGVAWINDKVAAEFKQKYPTIWNTISEIMVADSEDMC
jgi:hypothetical protein